jgi:hypothetical protein
MLDLIESCFEARADHRPRNAADVVQAISAMIQPPPPPPPPAAAPEQPYPPAVRPKPPTPKAVKGSRIEGVNYPEGFFDAPKSGTFSDGVRATPTALRERIIALLRRSNRPMHNDEIKIALGLVRADVIGFVTTELVRSGVLARERPGWYYFVMQ